MSKPITISLTTEEATVLLGVLEKIDRQLQRDTRPEEIAEFLREKSMILPNFEDLTVLAKDRGLYSPKTSNTDVAASLRRAAIKLGLIADPEA